MSVYRSKVDVWVALVMLATLAVSFYALGDLLRSGARSDWVGVAIIVLTLGGSGAILVPLRYLITDTELIVRSGLLRYRVPLDAIRRVSPSRTLLASPAWSLDRIGIEYGSGRYARPTIHISPVRKEEFLEELAARAGLERQNGEWRRPEPDLRLA